MRTRIIYEDNDIAVIYKPAGLATQTARVGQADVVSELKNYFNDRKEKKDTSYVGVIHRLDQPVEGLLVFARNRESAAKLSAQLSGKGKSGVLNKQYYAVFCATPIATEGELVDYIRKTADGRAEIVPGSDCVNERNQVTGIEFEKKGVSESAPRKAVMYYRVIDSVNLEGGEQLQLADIRITTGRFHQIRVQMSHAGMALLGDPKYGDVKSVECSRKLGISTVALCAYQLELKHPKTGKIMSFQIIPEGRAFSGFSSLHNFQ